MEVLQSMPTPTASPTVSSTIGLKNVVIAPLEVDTEETLTYGTLQSMVGAIDASITPSNSDPDVQYCDEGYFFLSQSVTESSNTLRPQYSDMWWKWVYRGEYHSTNN
jgi:hypothetical protein